MILSILEMRRLRTQEGETVKSTELRLKLGVNRRSAKGVQFENARPPVTSGHAAAPAKTAWVQRHCPLLPPSLPPPVATCHGLSSGLEGPMGFDFLAGSFSEGGLPKEAPSLAPVCSPAGHYRFPLETGALWLASLRGGESRRLSCAS